MKSFPKTSLVLLLFVSTIGFSMIPAATAQSWLTGWSDRQGITITNSTGAGINYQVYLDVTYDSDMQPDFDDLRFTDDDGSTLLDYWLEYKIDSSYADIWVEITDNLNSTQIIYMYYGNDAVSSVSNGDDTFLLFDDFEDSILNTDKWDFDQCTETGGSIQIDIAGKYFKSDDKFGPAVALEARTKQAGQRKHNMGFADPAPPVSGPEQWIIHASSGDAYMYEGFTDTGTLSYPLDTWTIESIYWKDADEGEYDIDRASKEDRDDSDIPDSEVYVSFSRWGSSTAVYYIDWAFLRNWVEIEPVALFGIWTEVNPARFIFPIGWDPVFQFGYDAFFIFLGLIMIPASTLYLVRGGRKEMSTDKLFYALIVFVVGLGLLIGGIMP